MTEGERRERQRQKLREGSLFEKNERSKKDRRSDRGKQTHTHTHTQKEKREMLRLRKSPTSRIGRNDDGVSGNVEIRNEKKESVSRASVLENKEEIKERRTKTE